ncbi:hypothetical protein, partial [Gluconobacter sphaericus]|uniref:hypothetical protein n=1 Tax=Gluconobacter sphaericus TaxID=574987 RepID=UPI001D1796CB
CNVGHSASLFWRPHPEFESRNRHPENHSRSISKRTLSTELFQAWGQACERKALEKWQRKTRFTFR